MRGLFVLDLSCESVLVIVSFDARPGRAFVPVRMVVVTGSLKLTDEDRQPETSQEGEG